MATRKKKRFWNEGGIPGLDLPAPPKTMAEPAPHVPVTPSAGLVFSPRDDDDEKPGSATEKEK